MHDWNVVVTLHEGKFVEGQRVLQKLGPVGRTGYFNVLVMRVEDIHGFLESLRQRVAAYSITARQLAVGRPLLRRLEYLRFPACGSADEHRLA